MNTEKLKEELKKIVWDYEISLEELIQILEGRKKSFSLNREKILARLLLSVNWYKLLEIFDPQVLKEILNDEVLKYIHIESLRQDFIYAREALSEL
ncbi:MAG: hypothetical protein B6D56_07705 [Candidatus Omnitrophica bacterium 4484_70.1]|nr:MAG: hypothetical protein B6D56_07705 [Candidatus Omnitrophica bacterium 4484_70.1]